MRKVIPKIPKVKGLFKNLPWFDMIYLAISGLMCLIIFFSNLGVIKYIVVALIIMGVGMSEIRKDDISFARTLWLMLKSLTKPTIYINEKLSHGEKVSKNIVDSHDEKNIAKTENSHGENINAKVEKSHDEKSFAKVEKFYDENINAKVKKSHDEKISKNASSKKQEFGNISGLHSIEEIKDNTIIFESGVMAQLIEIPDVTFVLKENVTQEKYQDAFGKSFNIIAPYKNATLMKTERDVDFAEFVANLSERIKHIKKLDRLNSFEKSARIKTLNEKIKQFKQLEHSCRIPVYHIVIRGGSMSELEAVTGELISDFESAEITAFVASSKNIAYAIASQYQQRVNLDNVAEGAELAQYVLPSKIEVQKNKLLIDGTPISTYSINGLPGAVINAWLAELCSIADVNVTVNVCTANSRKLIRKIDRAYFTTGSEAEQTSKLSESVAKNSQQSSMESLLEDLEYAQDKLCEIEILISFVNDNIGAEKEINKHIMDLKMKRSINKFAQLENFCNLLVGSVNMPLKSNKLIFTTKLMGMAFPMIFPNLLEPNGDLIGFNNCGVPIVLDYHKRDGKLRVNSNQCVFGKSGGGKSFGLKLQTLLRASSGDIFFIIDVECEYVVIAESLGGLVIDLSKGDFKINPLQPFSISFNGKNSVTEHIIVVEEFFKILFKDLSMQQRIIIRELLARLYDKFGITDDMDIRTVAVDKFPIMQDLYVLLNDCIKEEKDAYVREEMIKLRLVVRSMLTGTFAKFWNGHSALTSSNNFVVFNVQSLVASGNLDVVNAQMQLISRYINTHLIENYQKLSHGEEYGRMTVLIDEVHRMLSPGMTVTIDLCAWLAKQCRKYEGALVVASQAVIDLTATAELMSKTKAVLTESQINILFGCKGTHITDLVNVYKHANITKMETDYLIEAKQGCALLMVSDTMRYEIKVSANDYEFGLCSRKIDKRSDGENESLASRESNNTDVVKNNLQIEVISEEYEINKKLDDSEDDVNDAQQNCLAKAKVKECEKSENAENTEENKEIVPTKNKTVKISKAVAIAKEAEAYVSEFNQKEKEETDRQKQKKKLHK